MKYMLLKLRTKWRVSFAPNQLFTESISTIQYVYHPYMTMYMMFT